MRITGEKNLKDKLVLNLVPNRYLPAVFILKNISVDWNGRYETPAGKAWPRGDPAGDAEEAPARPGKRVPVVEINERSHFTNPQKKDCKQILSSLNQKGSI
ncbi:hypothetical protein ACQKOM_11955 [Peribacillus frigoritolerans]|uniref:hypothetical protein n=1 Tax=Peribacillus frigoritolerans TaxID=450367 RepID=UPI003CFCACC9